MGPKTPYSEVSLIIVSKKLPDVKKVWGQTGNFHCSGKLGAGPGRSLTPHCIKRGEFDILRLASVKTISQGVYLRRNDGDVVLMRWSSLIGTFDPSGEAPTRTLGLLNPGRTCDGIALLMGVFRWRKHS